MSNTAYAAAFKPVRPSAVAAFLRELFLATPLGLLLQALNSRAETRRP